MEHSLLHALQLLGTILTLGGAFLVLGLLRPARAGAGSDPPGDAWLGALEQSVSRWVWRGAWIGLLATGLDLFVQVAEAQGQTVFAGVDPGLAVEFATTTIVGRLSLVRMLALLLAALAVRLGGRFRWGLVAAFGFVAVVFTGLVSHAAAQSAERGPSIAAQVAHILAVAVWIGILIHLFLARRAIRQVGGSLGPLARIMARFSPLALGAAFLLVLTGGFAAYRSLGTPGAMLTSAYGLTLAVKLSLLVLVLTGGFINYRIIRPALERLARDASATEAKSAVDSVLARFCRALELEVTAGVLVICVAGILASVSPPRQDQTVRLTEAQARALEEPHLPVTAIADPSTFYGAPTRTIADRRYAEFTHNWSGVMVVLMGLCWLVQSLGRRWAEPAGRFWPFLLVPFAIFVEVASDPEVWLLRQASVRQVLADPIVLEHQLGAAIILVMVWLGCRDRRLPAEQRPLGRVLPAIMILGSILLLGHAHAGFTETQGLTNLINVQHAILGGLGLAAGTIRWLSLRGLFPERVARVAWPGFVIAVGLFMAFFYREVV
ncbi:MAG TPA: CopD family protein [Candidatus Sulfotelmatobacter sp.]|nr:CopD family protein [Candidatus Sulfotelmatobacter sp.]